MRTHAPSHARFPAFLLPGEHPLDKVLAYFRQIREGHNAEDTFAEDMGDTSTAAAVAESAAAPINNPPTNATDAAAAASGEKRPITSTI